MSESPDMGGSVSQRPFGLRGSVMGALLPMLCIAALLSVTNRSNAAKQLQREIRECNILLPEGVAAGAYAVNLWPFGIVPYDFDPNVNAENQQRALDAMADIEAVSAVSFVPLDFEENYILIRSGSTNSSYIGMIGGAQPITIFNWEVEFIIVHELIHALGSWHEHQRTDRDDYVQINWRNIMQGSEHNFELALPPPILTGLYDFDSVMHYAQFAFSANGKPTITVLPPNKEWQELIGQLDHLSDWDIDGLVDMYGPPGPQPMEAISRAFTVGHTAIAFQEAISRSFTVGHTAVEFDEAISRAFTVLFQPPPPCPADFDNSGDVGVKDLLFLLGTWGPCPPKGGCPADFDDTGDVGVKDLLFLLGNWGPCP